MKSIVLVIYIIFAISTVQCSENDHAINSDIKVCFVAGSDIVNNVPAQDNILNLCPEGMNPCNEICCWSDWHCEIIKGVSTCLPPDDDFDMPHGPGYGYIDVLGLNNTKPLNN